MFCVAFPGSGKYVSLPLTIGIFIFIIGFSNLKEAYQDKKDFDRKFIVGLLSLIVGATIIVYVIYQKSTSQSSPS